VASNPGEIEKKLLWSKGKEVAWWVGGLVGLVGCRLPLLSLPSSKLSEIKKFFSDIIKNLMVDRHFSK